MTTVGVQRTSHDRSGVSAIFDIFLSLLKEKAPIIRIPYGIPDDVEPFYTVSFPKSYSRLPSVCLTVSSDKQREGAIGRMIGGANHGDESGVIKRTVIVFDVWARNSLELEVISSRVSDVFNMYKPLLNASGIIDYVQSNSTMRPYDPNAPRMWFGSEQAPGETWLRGLEYTIKWFSTWTREEEVYEIKRIDATIEPYGVSVEISVGALHMGLLDTMFYGRYLGRNIKLPRIIRGRY